MGINMDHSNQFKQFNIAHQHKNRLRIIAHCLIKDGQRALILRILLLKREAIKDVKIVPDIGSVTIRYDAVQLPTANLLMLLEAILTNVGLKPKQVIDALGIKKTVLQGSAKTINFAIQGMSCSSCALYIEMMLKRDPKVSHASVNFITETASVTGTLSKKELFALINANGYHAVSMDTLSERKEMFKMENRHRQDAKKQLIIAAALGLPIPFLSIFGKRSLPVILTQATLSSIVVFWSGKDFFKNAARHAKLRTADMDTLIALGVGAAYTYSLPSLFRRSSHVYFEAASGIIAFVLLGRFLEEVAKGEVLRDIRKLVNQQPQEATLLKGTNEIQIPVEDIVVGDILLIRPGEKIPADGEVIKGLSMVNEAPVTGAGAPCIKEAGHQVLDGSMNGSGVLHVRATATGTNTVLSGLVHMVDQAQTSKLPIQKTVDKISAVFVPAVIVLAGVTFGGWLFKGEKLAHALANAISVLLISCPCALGLATPAATMVGTGQAARKGIYIRNGVALETAANLQIIIFDKTGTITEGKPEISDLLNVSAWDDDTLIQLAASAEFNSEHFLAKAIVEYAHGKDLDILESSHFHSIPDRGIRATVGEHEVLLGNEPWLNEKNIDLGALAATAKRLSSLGRTLVFLAIDNQPCALFAFIDPIRPHAREVIKHLHDRGIQTLMVTGDTEQAANQIAGQVGITTVIADASPARKLKIIRDLQSQGKRVAMVGDGINDAPALAAADVGMSIGKATGIAIETSDMILINGDIAQVAESIELSGRTLAVIKQNLFWAFSYNALAIPIAMAGRLNPLIASGAMALSSVSVIANSLRLKDK